VELTLVAAGAISLVVSVATTYLSNNLSRKNKMEEMREQYRLEAMKSFRETVGPPKGQIIESMHDLSDRLRAFLDRRQSWAWTDRDDYYRRSFIWLIVRPAVWMEILRRHLVHLDQTLGSELDTEFRFREFCDRYERSLSDVSLFANTGYDSNEESAHVFSGTLRSVAERLVIEDAAGMRCIRYSDFELNEGARGLSIAEPLAHLVTGLGQAAEESPPYRLARLIGVYCTVNAFLEHHNLPYETYETLGDSKARLTLLPEPFRSTVAVNIEAALGTSKGGGSI
jgi:hypothetical protein